MLGLSDAEFKRLKELQLEYNRQMSKRMQMETTLKLTESTLECKNDKCRCKERLKENEGLKREF